MIWRSPDFLLLYTTRDLGSLVKPLSVFDQCKVMSGNVHCPGTVCRALEYIQLGEHWTGQGRTARLPRIQSLEAHLREELHSPQGLSNLEEPKSNTLCLTYCHAHKMYKLS